jgi:hypothetical protein
MRVTVRGKLVLLSGALLVVVSFGFALLNLNVPLGKALIRHSYDLLFIVRPNNDTIEGAGYLDPSEEPILVRVPDAGTRFWSIQLADAWTNMAICAQPPKM